MIERGTRGLDLDRRSFLEGVAVSWASLVLLSFGGCERILDSIAHRPLRRRLVPGSPEVSQDLEVYRDAVARMMALPDDDPRNWRAQSEIHGTVVPDVFNHCQHNTDHFFSWHRAYLFYFEQICRELTGEASFGLPYWNWNQNPGIHPAFLDASSELHHDRIGTTVAGVSAFSNDTMNTIFADGNFFTFGSQIEGTPHNTAHVVVNADMVTGGSPLDPVFWAHHCMVDYCWAKWNIELGNDNTNDAAWNGTSWNHFVDGKGNPATVTAGTTTLMPLLSYRYESSAVGGFGAMPVAMTKRELAEVEKRVRAGADVRFEVKQRFRLVPGVEAVPLAVLSASSGPSLRELSGALSADPESDRVFVSIEYAKLPPSNDFFVRVFLNRPDAVPSTSIEDPHYAGSFAFFGVDHGDSQHAHGGRRFLVNVSDTIAELRAAGRMGQDEAISVQLVVVPMATDHALSAATLSATRLQLEGIDLLVAPVRVRSR